MNLFNSEYRYPSFFLALTILLCFSYPLFPENIETFNFGKSGISLQKLVLHNAEIIKSPSMELRLSLKKKKKEGLELYLDFENKKPSNLKDRTGKYKVQFASYTDDTIEYSTGKRSAFFSGKGNRITIETDPNMLLGKIAIRKDFFISFYIKPSELETDSIIFKKFHFFAGEKHGFVGGLKGKRFYIELSRFFKNQEGIKKSIKLQSSDLLKKKSWNHIVIQYSAQEEFISITQNEKESAHGSFLSDDGNAMIGGFSPEDSTPFYIGDNYYGHLDDFMIGYGKYTKKIMEEYHSTDEDRYFADVKQISGTGTSEVYKSKYSSSKLKNLSVDMELPENTRLDVFIRISDKIFDPNSDSPSWTHLRDFNSIKNKKFQFFQWKANLRSDPDGKNTPSFNALKLDYIPSKPPQPPASLSVHSINHDKKEVCLKWLGNHENNVLIGGGYIISYGVKKDTLQNHIKVTLPENTSINGNTSRNITFCIDNSRILANSTPDLPLVPLKPGITYFFRVYAYNSSYSFHPDQPGYDQKSSGSDIVSGTLASLPDLKN